MYLLQKQYKSKKERYNLRNKIIKTVGYEFLSCSEIQSWISISYSSCGDELKLAEDMVKPKNTIP